MQKKKCKIKIIDLLNKIANDEKVPKTILYNNVLYNYEEFCIGKGDSYFNAIWEYKKGYRATINNTFYYFEIRDYKLNDYAEIIKHDTK